VRSEIPARAGMTVLNRDGGSEQDDGSI
jgi:hypothetical protein